MQALLTHPHRDLILAGAGATSLLFLYAGYRCCCHGRKTASISVPPSEEPSKKSMIPSHSARSLIATPKSLRSLVGLEDRKSVESEKPSEDPDCCQCVGVCGQYVRSAADAEKPPDKKTAAAEKPPDKKTAAAETRAERQSVVMREMELGNRAAMSVHELRPVQEMKSTARVVQDSSRPASAAPSAHDTRPAPAQGEGKKVRIRTQGEKYPLTFRQVSRFPCPEGRETVRTFMDTRPLAAMPRTLTSSVSFERDRGFRGSPLLLPLSGATRFRTSNYPVPRVGYGCGTRSSLGRMSTFY